MFWSMMTVKLHIYCVKIPRVCVQQLMLPSLTNTKLNFPDKGKKKSHLALGMSCNFLNLTLYSLYFNVLKFRVGNKEAHSINTEEESRRSRVRPLGSAVSHPHHSLALCFGKSYVISLSYSSSFIK